MKKLLIAAGISAAMASPTVFADYEVYGKAHIGILSADNDHADGSSSSDTNLHSFASRVGIKGSTELAEGLDAIYKWETEVDLTGGNTGKTSLDEGKVKTSLLKARNQFVGLKGGFGTIIGGIHDTPMKSAEGKIDLFSDVVDIAKVQDPYMDTQERESDLIAYYSPKFGHSQVQFATMPGKGEGLGDAFSTAFVYGDRSLKKSSFYTAIAYDSGVDETDDSSAIRLAGSTKFSGATVGAIIEQADSGRDGADTQLRYVLSGKYKIGGKNTLLLQYADSEGANNGKKEVAGSTDITFGIAHSLAKTTSVYGALNKSTNVGGKKDDDATNLVLGLVHKFKF